MEIPVTVMDALNFITGIDDNPPPRKGRLDHHHSDKVAMVRVDISEGDGPCIIWSLPRERFTVLFAQADAEEGRPASVEWWEYRLEATPGGTLRITRGSTIVELNSPLVRLFLRRGAAAAEDSKPTTDVDKLLSRIFPEEPPS